MADLFQSSRMAKTAGDSGDNGDTPKINALAAVAVGDKVGTRGDRAYRSANLSPTSPRCPQIQSAPNGLKSFNVPNVPNVPTCFSRRSKRVVPGDELGIWRAHIEAMTQVSDGSLELLRSAMIQAAGAPWLADAFGKGWDAVSLFWVHPVAPTVRTEAWGLCVCLALSPFNRRDRKGQWHRTRLVEITATKARIETPTGQSFGMSKNDPSRAYAVPVWDLEAFAPLASTTEAASLCFERLRV